MVHIDNIACINTEKSGDNRESFTMNGLSYSDIYKNLDGMTALTVAASMPLRKHKDEKDTAFVKRIVACYLTVASRYGVHEDAPAKASG